MKLKCDRHQRRVMRITETHFTHRSDGTKCPGHTASIGGISYAVESTHFHLNGPSQDVETPEERLLKNIFMDPSHRTDA